MLMPARAPRVRRGAATALVTALVAALIVGLPSGGPAAAAEDEERVCEPAVSQDQHEPLTDTKGSSDLPGLLNLEDAHELSTGSGVGVAVIDSGVVDAAASRGRVDVRTTRSVIGENRPVYDSHGTMVAGLIAGSADGKPLGVAPDAHLVPIRVTDLAGEVEGDAELPGGGKPVPLSAGNVASAIRAAIQLPDALNVKVINLSLQLDRRDPAVAQAINDAWRAGILVVAAAGNRPQPPDGEEIEEGDPNAYEVGEKRVAFPATMSRVVAATSIGEENTVPTQFVLTGPEIDVSAPVSHVVTLAGDGATCFVEAPATSWAAAAVSGLAALVFARFPGIEPGEVAARIEATARGGYRGTALDGSGMIEPVSALTAELKLTRNGRLARIPGLEEKQPRIVPPDPEGDPTADSREKLVWWGLGGGAALLLVLLVRPLLVRRSR